MAKCEACGYAHRKGRTCEGAKRDREYHRNWARKKYANDPVYRETILKRERKRAKGAPPPTLCETCGKEHNRRGKIASGGKVIDGHVLSRWCSKKCTKKSRSEDPVYIEKRREQQRERTRKLMKDPVYREQYLERERERCKRRWKDPVYRDQRLKKQKQQWQNPFVRENHRIWKRKWRKKRMKDPVYREKILMQTRESNHRLWEDPVYREKILTQMREKYDNDPIYREKILKRGRISIKEIKRRESHCRICGKKFTAMSGGLRPPLMKQARRYGWLIPLRRKVCDDPVCIEDSSVTCEPKECVVCGDETPSAGSKYCWRCCRARRADHAIRLNKMLNQRRSTRYPS